MEAKVSNIRSEPVIFQISADEWNKNWAEAAHKTCFSEIVPGGFYKIDYALLVGDPESPLPRGYCTVRELDDESVYWQYGGAFPGTINSIHSARCYEALVEWTKQRYERITTYVQNTNVAYLKLCMHFGFRIIGVKNFKGRIFVELLNEFEEKGAN